jgi:hypothetical protein
MIQGGEALIHDKYAGLEKKLKKKGNQTMKNPIRLINLIEQIVNWFEAKYQPTSRSFLSFSF